MAVNSLPDEVGGQRELGPNRKWAECVLQK